MTDTLNSLQKQEPKPKKDRTLTMVWIVMIALLAGNAFAVWRTSQIQGEMADMNATFRNQLIALEERAHDLTIRADTHEVMLQSELKETQEEAKTAATNASKNAEKKAEMMVSKLASEYRQKQAETLSEIELIKGTARQNGDAVFAVQNDVEGVRGDVKETKSDIVATREELRNELKTMRGDLGVQSGLIATNAKELSALRLLGERHYFEFDIPKDRRTYKIGHVGVALRNTKFKKGKFTLDVIADDRRVEKRDRTVNEPIQFYVTGAKQPYEIVVNEVKKDRVVGYLSVPRTLRAAR